MEILDGAKRPLAVIALAALLTSCVDVPNVTAFADSVTVVTAGTEQLVSSDRATCEDLNATLDEFEHLPKIQALGDVGKGDCESLDKVLDAIEGVNNVLDHYGKALAAISRDSVVNFDSDVSSLQGILKALPVKTPPTNEQIAAVGGLAGWIASLVTRQARDKAIHNALVGPKDRMKTHFHNVVALLQSLSKQYAEGVQANGNVHRGILQLVSTQYGRDEAVAVAEVRNRLAKTTRVTDAQKAALDEYNKGLDAMNRAFDAASAQPTAKQLLHAVRDFAEQAKNVYQSLTRAFPNR
jgi:hypothetical protein